MTDKDICEQTEICILSDTGLTEQQKKHIEVCEGCRGLLSQIESMRGDIKNNAPVFYDSEKFTEAVMSEARKYKKHNSMPKFRLTHHLGTAAAIVIIFAAALMLKNPTSPEVFDEGADNGDELVFTVPGQNNHVLRGVVSASDGTSLAEDAAASGAASGGGGGGNSFEAQPAVTAAEAAEVEAAEKMLMLADVPEYCDEYGDNECFDGSDDIIYDTYSATTYALPEAEEAKEAEEAEEAEEATENDELRHDEQKPDGTQSTAQNAPAVMMYKSPGVKKESREMTLSSEYIFEGLAFEEGESGFTHNISLINERLSEVLGEGYVISAQKLSALDVDNAAVIQLAPTLTQQQVLEYFEKYDILE